MTQSPLRKGRTSESRRPRSGPRTLTVRDIMSTDVVLVDPELTLRDAVELLAKRHISGAPVVAAGAVVGVISANDVLTFEADTPGVPTEVREQPEQDALESAELEEDQWLTEPERELLEEHTVEEAMSRGVRSVRPGLSVPDAAAYMLRERIHRAVVLEGKELVGIVTATDIMRAVAERRI